MQSAADIQTIVKGCIDDPRSPEGSQFVARFHRVIASTAIKTANLHCRATPELVDDLIQKTYVRLFENERKALRQFRGESPERIFGYIQAVTYSVVKDHFKKVNSISQGGAARHVPFETAEKTGADSTPAYERKLLIGRVATLLEQIAPPPAGDRDRLIFWLYYRDGFTTRSIAELPNIGLSQAGVESVIQRLMSELRKRVGRQEPEKGTGERNAS